MYPATGRNADAAGGRGCTAQGHVGAGIEPDVTGTCVLVAGGTQKNGTVGGLNIDATVPTARKIRRARKGHVRISQNSDVTATGFYVRIGGDGRAVTNGFNQDIARAVGRYRSVVIGSRAVVQGNVASAAAQDDVTAARGDQIAQHIGHCRRGCCGLQINPVDIDGDLINCDAVGLVHKDATGARRCRKSSNGGFDSIYADSGSDAAVNGTHQKSGCFYVQSGSAVDIDNRTAGGNDRHVPR